jgi:membrane protein insertase Oxa1/YidC/SpoIIIJ
VLRPPVYEPVQENDQVVAYEVVNNHLPIDSQLFANTLTHTDRTFLTMNMDCTPRQVWQGPPTDILDTEGNPAQAGLPLRVEGEPVDGYTSQATLACGSSRAAVIPYAILLVVMTGAQIFSTWQMQRLNPPGSQTGSQQAILRLMPLLFLFFGISFVTALILYWSTSSVVQVIQQTILIRLGHIGPVAVEKRRAEQQVRQQQAAAQPPKQGFLQRMMARAEETATQREQQRKPRPQKGTQRATGGTTKGKRSTPPAKKKRPGSTKPGNQLKRPDPGSSGGTT